MTDSPSPASTVPQAATDDSESHVSPVLVGIIGVVLVGGLIALGVISEPSPNRDTTVVNVPVPQVLADTPVPGGPLPHATLVTSFGEITIELYEDDAPNAVANFVELAEQGFYRKVRFHRIIQGFMIQTGDPNSRSDNQALWGMGGPGYRFAHEPNAHRFARAGVVAYANSGPDTNGSQFFITDAPAASLDPPGGQYTIFGQVVDGLNVVNDIAAVPVRRQGQNAFPLQDVFLEDVRITGKRAHLYRVTNTHPE